MNINFNDRKGVIHLYNPEKEGLGCYDVHYINAYKKDKIITNKSKKNHKERYAA